MTLIYTIMKSKTLLAYYILFSSTVIIAGCATAKTEGWNRTEVPLANMNVPISASEIREIKYYKSIKESGHKDLHMEGQVFTKTNAGGTTQIKPCGSCVVRLSIPADTSIKINVITESDGYFSYHGQNKAFVLTLENAGHNRMEIGPIEFNSEGTTIFKIINAAGSSSERVYVTKNEKNYTWQ